MALGQKGGLLQDTDILGATWGSIIGTITNQTDLVNYLGSNYWNQAGNTLAGRKKFGSISGSFGWDNYINNVVVSGVANDAKHYWGTNGAFSVTDFSYKGSGFDLNSYTAQFKNSADTVLAWIRNDGGFNVQSGMFYSAGNLNMVLDDANITFRALSNAGLGATGNNNFFAGNAAGQMSADNYLNAYGTLALYLSTGAEKNAIGKSAGESSVGARANFLGTDAGKEANGDDLFFVNLAAGQSSTGNRKFGIGVYAARLNTESNVGIFGDYYNIYFNHDEARVALGTTLNTVTLQTAKAESGTNSSAASSILKLAQARGTDDADMGSIIIQRAVRTGTANGTRHTLSDYWYFDKDGNTGIGGNDYQDGIGVQYIAVSTTIPTTNPTTGFIFYIDPADDKYKARGISGTITEIALP